MVGHGAKFGRKKEQAIAALLSQRSIEEAARKADVGVNTLRRWLKEPEFDLAYRNARQTAFAQCIARLQHASSAAVSVVLKIMLDQNAPSSARLRAADIVLARSAKAIELEDVEARVSKLERAKGTHRSNQHEDRAKGQRSKLIDTKLQGPSADIAGYRPDFKGGTEHGLALPILAKREALVSRTPRTAPARDKPA